MARRKKYITCCCCNHKYLKREDRYSPELCPECEEPYWRRPKIEHDLMILQDQYFLSNKLDPVPFQQMMLIIEPLLHNIIASKLKSSAVYLEEEKRHDLVMESFISFIEKYENTDFRVTGSFVAYLQSHVLNPLYNPKKKEREQSEISISTPVKNNENVFLFHLIEVVEGVYGSEEYVLNRIQEEYQVEALSSLLDNIFAQCVVTYDIKTAFIILRSLELNLNPRIKEKKVLEYWEEHTNDLQLLSDKSMKSIYDFVQEELVLKNQVISLENFRNTFGEPKTENPTIIETKE